MCIEYKKKQKKNKIKKCFVFCFLFFGFCCFWFLVFVFLFFGFVVFGAQWKLVSSGNGPIVAEWNNVFEFFFQLSKLSVAHFHIQCIHLETATSYRNVEVYFRSHQAWEEFRHHERGRFIPGHSRKMMKPHKHRVFELIV